MTPILATFIFVFGTVIGSFLNAVVWRLRTGESVVKGRSYCPSCGHTLGARDLFPIISFLALRGKCRYCKKGISAHYMLVELAVGVLFLFAAMHLVAVNGPILSGDVLAELLRNWYFIAVLTVIFMFDLKYMLILRKVTIPATILAVAANLALGMSLWSLVLGAGIGWFFFYGQLLLSKGKWVGGGDAWLGLLMGVMLGWPMVGVALFLAYIMGAIIGSALLLKGSAHMKTQLPFGTFLSVATIAVLLMGREIFDWYLGLIL